MQEIGPKQETWLQALEQQRWPKANGFLGLTSGSRCCLGVACELQYVGRISESICGGQVLFGRENASLPETVREALAFIDSEGTFVNEEGDATRILGYPTLIDMNDGIKGSGDHSWTWKYPPLSHPQIAALVRQYPERVFSESK